MVRQTKPLRFHVVAMRRCSPLSIADGIPSTRYQFPAGVRDASDS